MKQPKIYLKIFLFIITLSFTQVACTQTAKPKTTANAQQYVCSPCGQDCDAAIFNKPGTCQHCGMPLVLKSTITFKSIESTAICDYIQKHTGIVLLDVRTKEEFEGKANPDFGTLKNAINIPVQELEQRLTELKALQNKEIIVYCSHSHRSPQASYILTQNGFTNITNMAGGMSVMTDKECKK